MDHREMHRPPRVIVLCGELAIVINRRTDTQTAE